MRKSPHIIVFTDLDGSLLDHHTYDYSAAKPAFERLQNHHIPILPVTSKTLDEIKALNIPFGAVPYIGENGMVIDVPDDFFKAPNHQKHQHFQGSNYQEITQFINDLPQDLRQCINGFNDMSIDDVVHHTGLSHEGAKLAKSRKASEPFLWSGDENSMAELEKNISQSKLSITRGGRFYHMMSNGGKDEAMRWILQTYRQSHVHNIITIALGDGPNDADMLACTTYGVKIKNTNGHSFKIQNPKGFIMETKDSGPKGWNDAIHKIMDDLGFSR